MNTGRMVVIAVGLLLPVSSCESSSSPNVDDAAADAAGDVDLDADAYPVPPCVVDSSFDPCTPSDEALASCKCGPIDYRFLCCRSGHPQWTQCVDGFYRSGICREADSGVADTSIVDAD